MGDETSCGSLNSLQSVSFEFTFIKRRFFFSDTQKSEEAFVGESDLIYC